MFRRNRNERVKSRIEKRASRLPTDELLGWSENAVYSTSRNLSAWQRDPQAAYLEEARLGAEALMAIIKTIHERTTHSER